MLEYRARASDFGEWLERNVNKVGYLIGTRGQTCTQSMIDARLASSGYESYWPTIREYASQWIGRVVADCEGLCDMFMNGGEWDKPLTSFKYADTTANGQYNLAVKEALLYGDISTAPMNEPCPIAVHMTGHVGFFYKGLVYQSIGHRRGFITTELAEAVNGKPWARWYYIPYLDYSAAGGGGGEPSMIKRGDTSRIVKALQLALVKFYGKLTGNDGTVYYAGDTTEFYGSATSNGVAQFQADNGLPVNGDLVDGETLATMMIALIALPNADPAVKAELDAAKIKIAQMTTELANTKNQLLIAQNYAAGLEVANSEKKDELLKVAAAMDTLKMIQDKY
jgi:hypothetical protein